MGLSVGERRFIEGGIAQDFRTDGRQRLIHRPIFIETGVIPQANGSARLRGGNTEVIATVKVELSKPSLSLPDRGRVVINAECSPTAASVFEGKGDRDVGGELSSALRTCLLGGRNGAGSGIDLSSLSIVEGKLCWDLYIDCLVVSSDGNLLDSLGASIKAALSNTSIPKVQVVTSMNEDDDPEIDVSDEEFFQFDTSQVPVIITLTKIGKHYIVDATMEEESEMSSALSVCVNRNGRVCGVTKRGGASLDPSIILDMISVARHVSKHHIDSLDSLIVAAEVSLSSS